MVRFAAFFIIFAGLAACETVGGLGRDIEAGGEAIQDTSDDVQAQM
ncbi:MAG: entericidin A/B family lipoprotein [Pseudomonadota bacterium]